MLAGLERGDGDGGVEMVGQGDGDGVNIGLVEEFVVIGVAAGYFEAFGGFLGAAGMDLGDGDGVGAGALGEAGQVVEPNATSSDDGATKSVGHK